MRFPARRSTSLRPTEYEVNPAGLAETIRETPIPYNDDRVTLPDPNSTRTATGSVPTRIGRRARNLGIAAGHQIFADELAVIRGHRQQAAADEARLVASEPRWKAVEQADIALRQLSLRILNIPNSALSRKAEVLSLAAKLLMLGGDAAALANLLWRNGTPLSLAIPIGASLAATVIATGSNLGSHIKKSLDRIERGAAPEGCVDELRFLYASENGPPSSARVLQFAAGGAMAGLLIALVLIGTAVGDSLSLSIGFACLACLTVVGSAAAEFYGTNAAHELAKEVDKRQISSQASLHGFEELEASVAGHTAAAEVLEPAAHHRAVAANISVEVTANGEPDLPNIFGYDEPQPPIAITTVEQISEKGNTPGFDESNRRNRARPTYLSIAPELATTLVEI